MQVEEFRKMVERLQDLKCDHFSVDGDIDWSEHIQPPASAEDFASELIFVICNSGMQNKVARKIFDKVMAAIEEKTPVIKVFGHAGKARAIEAIWNDRASLYHGYMNAEDKLANLQALPWIGGITKYHAAKNFGLQYAKPDVHLQRLADTFKTTPQALCENLAARTGFRVATVDLLLWRAAAEKILDTRTGQVIDP